MKGSFNEPIYRMEKLNTELKMLMKRWYSSVGCKRLGRVRTFYHCDSQSSREVRDKIERYEPADSEVKVRD